MPFLSTALILFSTALSWPLSFNICLKSSNIFGFEIPALFKIVCKNSWAPVLIFLVCSILVLFIISLPVSGSTKPLAALSSEGKFLNFSSICSWVRDSDPWANSSANDSTFLISVSWTLCITRLCNCCFWFLKSSYSCFNILAERVLLSLILFKADLVSYIWLIT